ncbi:hypothetical protein [Thioalkalivibrio paradoxus]|uniref:Uncharacterized protein n=1 Tax=Thioalkalivibrio paradoxus ARh 1 TaxID=713585 RepID=W0DSN0_9GAMM|nr:hypothetical protein [Thioalkalivibrio paradoxus]AHE99865.1 hypothetical protein THITH_01955 [Thioalkalivibrio paradoxus ARh 1]
MQAIGLHGPEPGTRLAARPIGGAPYCKDWSAQSLKLEAPGSSVRIELDRLAEARAVSRAAGARRRISLQLMAESGTAFLTITGPAPGDRHAGQVWQLVMESLLPANFKTHAPETALAPPPPPVDVDGLVAQHPLPQTRLGAWTLPPRSRRAAHQHVAARSRG